MKIFQIRIVNEKNILIKKSEHDCDRKHDREPDREREVENNEV
jgi:hypothetical protein